MTPLYPHIRAGKTVESLTVDLRTAARLLNVCEPARPLRSMAFSICRMALFCAATSDNFVGRYFSVIFIAHLLSPGFRDFVRSVAIARYSTPSKIRTASILLRLGLSSGLGSGCTRCQGRFSFYLSLSSIRARADSIFSRRKSTASPSIRRRIHSEAVIPALADSALTLSWVMCESLIGKGKFLDTIDFGLVIIAPLLYYLIYNAVSSLSREK